MIRLQRLCKEYTSGKLVNHVLSDINLNVNQGEFIAVMGPSGSGKSTLLNMIGCMDSITSGEYWYDDIPVHNLSGRALNRFRAQHIGFVFQQFALMTEYTVYENAELPLLAAGVSAADRRKKTKEALELLGIESLANQKVTLISGGEQQRCAIARAILAEGNTILCDEPTGALDSNNGVLIMECLKEINRRGKTVILVTHDKNMAEYADRIYHMKDGCLSSELL